VLNWSSKEKQTPLIKTFPTPITILMVVIVFAAISTWLLPAGQYSKLSASDEKHFVISTPSGDVNLPFTQNTLDSLGIKIAINKFINGDIRKPVSIPGTYTKETRHPQGLLKIVQAPIKGIYESIEIIFFILVAGGFVYVFNETGALVKGITSLAHLMQGREPLLIALLTSIFSFLGASYGMAEEAIVFYPLLVPLFIAAGYDPMVPLAVIFGGSTLGGIPAFSNPFSTIIAANAAGINWMDGLYERLLLFVITTGLMIWYILRYAAKVKKDPKSSIVYLIDGDVKTPYEMNLVATNSVPPLHLQTKLLLLVYLFTFIITIGGVIVYGWWTLEMTSVFLCATILVGLITRMNEKAFITQFIKGAESLLSVAFVVGIARGVTIVLSDGHVSDSILYYTANLVQGMPPAIFILLLLLFYFFFSLFISSTSGMAVLTMPIIGALAIIVNIPGREIINSYMYGMNIMQFIAPTGMVLPSLALVNVSLKAWIRFITPLLLILFVLCAVFLIAGIYW
jgi:uncharacterized ion transporter superfamily protein YfcC